MSPAEDPHTDWTSADVAAQALADAFGGHGEHGRDVPPNRRRVGETDNRRAPTFDEDPARRAALEHATDRDHETYTAQGYQPVECRYCRAEVSVRKNSEKHTSIRWPAAAVEQCPERDSWHEERDGTCPRMRQSIRHAFAEGIITLAAGVDPEDEEHMVNPLVAGSDDDEDRKDTPTI